MSARVEIFADVNFSRSSGPLESDYPSLRGFWNDRISSIKVYSGTWEFYEHINFGGRSFRVGPGHYNMTNGWNDSISSFRQVKQDAPAGPSGGGMAQEILNAHNRYRSAVGLPPLIWWDKLATDAQQWANHHAQNGLYGQHSHADGQGENLWYGPSGRFSFTQMVDLWGEEKRYFVKGGHFPNVSTTGNWKDVGRYTQIVWRNTTHVGGAALWRRWLLPAGLPLLAPGQCPRPDTLLARLSILLNPCESAPLPRLCGVRPS